MFRARKLLQPKIPASASEFCQQLPETSFALHPGLSFVLSKTGFGRTVEKNRFLPVKTGQSWPILVNTISLNNKKT